MSALDDARAVLADLEAPGWAKYDPAGMQAVVKALAALVAECESERAQLGELLADWPNGKVVHETRVAIAHEGIGTIATLDLPTMIAVWAQIRGVRVTDALRALLAKVEGA